jgi:uncharacterized membrane protein
MMNTPTDIPTPFKQIPANRWLLLLVFIAFGLRLYGLDTQSIWFDESLSALFAAQPLSVAIQSMLQEGLHHSPLFYILLRPFAAGGFNEFSLRFLSVALGVVTIPLLARLGQKVANARVGVLAAILLTLSPFHVWYSQEARMYTLLIFSATGAMFFFMRSLERRRTSNWLAMAFFTAVGINSHHFSFFIPLVQFVFILLTFKQNHSLLRPWVGAQLLVALSFIPWILVVLDWGQLYLSSASRQTPTLYDLLQTFWNFSIGYTAQLTFFVVISLIAFMAALVGGIWAVYWRQQGLLLILWLGIPPLVTFLVSLRLPTYLDRYLSLSLPPLLLLVAVGLYQIRRPLLRLIAIAFIVVTMMTGLLRVYFDATVYERADWRAVGAYLQKNAAPTDVIAPWFFQNIIPMSFYYHGHTPLEPVISFDKVNVPRLEASQKVWVIIDHPNYSAHLVGHCQEFDINGLFSLPAAKNWRDEHQNRLSFVEEFPCVRIEVYE